MLSAVARFKCLTVAGAAAEDTEKTAGFHYSNVKDCPLFATVADGVTLF
jgi:hypothetical protein